MKTVELVGQPNATEKIARELEANGVHVRVRDSTKPHEVGAPLSDVDLVVLLGTNGLGGAVREAARIRGIDCVALPHDWTRARPILEAKGVLALGQRPLERLAESAKETRCACGRMHVRVGLVSCPDGSIHGEKQCKMPKPAPAAVISEPAPAADPRMVSREEKIAWLRTEALRDRDVTASVIGKHLRDRFVVGIDSHAIQQVVRAARGESAETRSRGTRADALVRRREAEKLLEADPSRTLDDVSAEIRQRLGFGVASEALSKIRARVLRRLGRRDVFATTSPAREDDTVEVTWERQLTRSGKATL